MSEDKTSYTHDASDKKLDHAADGAKAAAKVTEEKRGDGPGHDPSKIARHDDLGKDRLFEQREQRDHAEKQSEKSRLSKEASTSDHPASDKSGNG